MKKILAVLLALAMVMTLIPTMAFADEQSFEVVKVTYTGSSSGRVQFYDDSIAVAEGERVEVIINLPENVTKVSVRNEDGWDDSTDILKVEPADGVEAGTFVDYGDGWYKITATPEYAWEGVCVTVYVDGAASPAYLYSIAVVGEEESITYDVGSLAEHQFRDANIEVTELTGDYDFLPEIEVTYGLVKATIVEAKDGGDRFQFKTGIDANADDVVKIVINASGLAGGQLKDTTQYIRGADRADKWSATVTPLDNGNVELSATAAGDTSELAFTLYGGGYAKDEFIYIESITVGDTVYKFADQDDVDAVGFTEYSQPTDLSFELITETADESVIWLGYIMPAKSSNRNTIFVEGAFTTGDVVSFLVFIGESSDVDNTDMYVRKSAKALYLGTNEEVYSGNHIVDFALPLLDDGEETGWYYIECVLQEDSTKLEFSVDGANVSDGDLGENIITCIAVNGELLDDTAVVTDNSGNPVTPEELDATGVELPEREALQLIVTGEGATVVVKDYEGTEVEPGEEALTEKYQYTVDVEVAEGYELVGILVNGEEFDNGDDFIATGSVEITVSTLQKFEADITAENATVVVKDAEGNAIEGEIEAGTEVIIEVEVAEGYELVSVTVNGEAYEAGTTVIVTEGLVVEVVTAEEVVEVEPTGAISMAVVAVMAVLGGAVVLKKREF